MAEKEVKKIIKTLVKEGNEVTETIIEERVKGGSKRKSGTWFAGVTYMTPEQLFDCFDKMKLRHYAFILHDHDVKEDGSPKGDHTHFVINTIKECTTQWVCNTLTRYQAEIGVEVIQNTLCQVAADPVQCYRYLRHADDPEKYQYSGDDVVTDDSGYWLIREEKRFQYVDDSNTAFNIITDIINHVPMFEMLKRYGREFVINRNHYYSFVQEMYSQEENCPHVDVMEEV